MSTRYITLVNLLASDRPLLSPGEPAAGYEEGGPGHEPVLFPEYPTWRDRSADIARHATTWLQDEVARQHGRLRPVVERVLREFLRCGLLEHGFARLWCPECRRSVLGGLELLVIVHLFCTSDEDGLSHGRAAAGSSYK